MGEVDKCERKKRWTMEKAILQANLEEAGDKAYQKELAEWDVGLARKSN